MKIEVVTDIERLTELRADWEGLLERSASNTPTLSPAWTLAWWREFGPRGGRALRAALFFEGTRLVGLAPLLERPFRYPPGIPFRRLELIASGEDQVDEICSEYIGVIVERGAEEGVAHALAQALDGSALGGWDELSLPAMSGDDLLPLLLARELRRCGLDARVEVTDVAPHIPLPATWDAYLAALPSSRRYLVRRSIRDLETWAEGTLRFERAETRADLERGKQILMALHAERWSAAGSAGVMEAPSFRAFHEEIMPALLERGALDLRWLTVRGHLAGPRALKRPLHFAVGADAGVADELGADFHESCCDSVFVKGMESLRQARALCRRRKPSPLDSQPTQQERPFR